VANRGDQGIGLGEGFQGDIAMWDGRGNEPARIYGRRGWRNGVSRTGAAVCQRSGKTVLTHHFFPTAIAKVIRKAIDNGGNPNAKKSVSAPG